MKFIFPDVITPIYKSIVESFVETLREQGHQASIFTKDIRGDVEGYFNALDEERADFIVISNFSNLFTIYFETTQKFLFEMINTKIIFIHHDNIFHGIQSWDDIFNRLNAYESIKERSWHFCLEFNDYVEMKNYGFLNCYPVNHASEFSKAENQSTVNPFETTFVGHALPPEVQLFQKSTLGHQFLNLEYWQKVCNPGTVDQSAIDGFIEHSSLFLDSSLEVSDKVKRLLFKYDFINELHKGSPFHRGEILSQLTDCRVDVFGGDPGYLHGMDRQLRIQNENFTYHPPVNRTDSAAVFMQSKINLNITSLQFETAVINRVVDVGMLGGFVLTDRKKMLENVTSVWKEISYNSTAELLTKIDMFLGNDKLRNEVAAQFHYDVSQKCSYVAVVQDILSKL